MNPGTIEAITYRPPQPPPETTLIAHKGAVKMTRAELALLPVPEATRTHKPIGHISIASAIIESLGFRGIQVTREEYAATPDGNRAFGVMQINHGMTGLEFALAWRNSNDKAFRFAMTVGFRTFVCDNLQFRGDFYPINAKHSNSLNLIDVVSIGIDRIQRGFEPFKYQIDSWQKRQLTDDEARLILYRAFVEKQLKAPAKLLPDVHRHFFEPQYEEFKEKTFWSLGQAFTSAFKELNPINQYQATAKLGGFLQQYW